MQKDGGDAGQGIAGPSQCVFYNHSILAYSDASNLMWFYDPSYGKRYTSLDNIESSLLYGLFRNPLDGQGTSTLEARSITGEGQSLKFAQ
jgi:hypothetical protein